MAEFVAGASDPTAISAPPAPSPHTGGKFKTVAPRSNNPRIVLEFDAFLGAAFDTAGGVVPPGGTSVEHVGQKDDITVGEVWFDHVHVLPRGGLDFGSVITSATKTFELFNAYSSETTLTTFLNNAGVGISVPDLPALPTTLSPMVSLLDPTSTEFSPVLLDVQADPEGPATFAANLDFTFSPGGLVQLFVQGTRITFVMVEPERPWKESLIWNTSVLSKQDGSEQRISNRKQPRQEFQHTYRLSDLDRRLYQTLLFGHQGREFAVPQWEENVKLTAAVTGGVDTTLTVENTDDLDLRIGGFVTLYQDAEQFDVLTVDSFTSTTITVESAPANSYAIGDLAMPTRKAIISGQVRGSRQQITLEDFRVRYIVNDNDTGALTADDGGRTLHNSQIVLSDCNVMTGASISEGFQTRVVFLDTPSGEVYQEPLWTRFKRTHNVTLRAESRAEIKALRRLLLEFRGQQVAFWVPTNIEDVTVTQNLSSGSDQLVIGNIDYTRFVNAVSPKNTIRVTFTDNTSLIRGVLSAVETSATEETLTLDANWPANRTVSEIQRAEFLELVRQAEDTVSISHERLGSARVSFPVVTVFD